MEPKQSKATELNASIRHTIEQLANETDAVRQSALFRDYLKTAADSGATRGITRCSSGDRSQMPATLADSILG